MWSNATGRRCARRSGQLEETFNMKPAWKGWGMPPLTSLHLIVYIACVAQRKFNMSLGFTLPEADPSTHLPMKSALRDWLIGSWADKSPTRKSGGTPAGTLACSLGVTKTSS